MKIESAGGVFSETLRTIVRDNAEGNQCERGVFSCVSQLNFKPGDVAVNQQFECLGEHWSCQASFGDYGNNNCTGKASSEGRSCVTINCTRNGSHGVFLRGVLDKWPSSDLGDPFGQGIISAIDYKKQCATSVDWDLLKTDTSQVLGLDTGMLDESRVIVREISGGAEIGGWVNGKTWTGVLNFLEGQFDGVVDGKEMCVSTETGDAIGGVCRAQDGAPPVPTRPDVETMMNVVGQDLCRDDPAKGVPGVSPPVRDVPPSSGLRCPPVFLS